MKTYRLGESSFTDAKWIAGLSLLAFPLSYGINVVLGKIDPQVLGTYGLLALYSSLIPTFLLFGGSQVIVRFLPTVDVRKKFSFIASYSILVLALAGIALFYVRINPTVVSFISRRELEEGLLPYLALLTPILLLFHICTATLWAQMEIKWMAVSQKLNVILSFMGASLLYFWLSRMARESIPTLVASFVLVSFALSLFLALYHTYTKVIAHFPLTLELFFPPGFWHFAVAVYLGTVFSFTLERFDQALVWSQLSLSDLGIYRAPLATAEVVRWLPNIAAQIALPLFANLLARADESQMTQTYGVLTKYTILAASAVALPVVLFSREILAVFGKSYLEGDVILSILASAFILSAISAINTSLLVARGRASLVIVNGLVPSVVQIPIALLLIEPLGLVGVSIGKATAVVSYTLANSLMVLRLWGMRPHKQVLLVLVMDVGVIALSQLINTNPHGLIKLMWKASLLSAFAFTLVKVGILGREDVRLFTRLLLGSSSEPEPSSFPDLGA